MSRGAAGLWLALLAGCGAPCTDLADKVCERAGEASDICKQSREVAKHPSEADQRACRAGVAFAEQLEKR